MKLIIHRGTHQIGGSCVEVQSGGRRLILDLGMPLAKPDGSPFPRDIHANSRCDLVTNGVLPPVGGLYAGDDPEVSALLLSHAHIDHYGLADFAHPAIPIYASAGTRALLEVSRLFLPSGSFIPGVLVIPKAKPVQMGPFTVTSYLVDHSAPDAVMMLIEAEGKRVLYSGDLRAHGRKAILFERMVANPPGDIDCLLLEGTMLGRDKQEYADENAVEEALLQLFKEKSSLALVFCSSQNLDRLVSIYRAAKRSDRTLLIDLYTAYVLQALQSVSRRIPQCNWPGVRVMFWHQHADALGRAGKQDFLYAAVRSRIKDDEIIARADRIVMLAEMNRLFPIIPGKLPGTEGLELVWSMWKGYLSGDDPVSLFARQNRLQVRYVHTSGHATVADLQRLASAIQPRMLVPIHTFQPDRFPDLFDNVLSIADGEAVTL